MTEKQETSLSEETTEAVASVSAIVIRPFHGVITADGGLGWAHPGDVLDVTPNRRAELLSAELIEREEGDPASVQGAATAIGAPRDTTRKLKVSGSTKAKA